MDDYFFQEKYNKYFLKYNLLLDSAGSGLASGMRKDFMKKIRAFKKKY